MFSSSVRRVVSSAVQTPVASVIAPSAPRAALSSFAFRTHQRRLSSSKPSNPADGPKGLAKEQEVAATSSEGSKNIAGSRSRAVDGKKTARSKRKANNASSDPAKAVLLNVPSVPSTHHLAPEDVAASAFFALHRPISVTTNFPKPVSEESFAAIFSQRTQHDPSDVMSTLSDTVSRLEGGAQGVWKDEAPAEDKHVPSFRVPYNIVSSKYQPFNPPPAPVPMMADEILAAEEAALDDAMQHRTYRTVLTIEESTDANGDVTYMAHSSPLMEEAPAPSRSMIERTRRERLWTISVRRQRKLKMKKHKYKKLMKRTRNLRRRQDRN